MSGVFESRESTAYWAYHVGRMGFFTVQGITGGYCINVRDVFTRPVCQQRHHQGRQCLIASRRASSCASFSSKTGLQATKYKFKVFESLHADSTNLYMQACCRRGRPAPPLARPRAALGAA